MMLKGLHLKKDAEQNGKELNDEHALTFHKGGIILENEVLQGKDC